jgi:hypothetical protein
MLDLVGRKKNYCQNKNLRKGTLLVEKCCIALLKHGTNYDRKQTVELDRKQTVELDQKQTVELDQKQIKT